MLGGFATRLGSLDSHVIGIRGGHRVPHDLRAGVLDRISAQTGGGGQLLEGFAKTATVTPATVAVATLAPGVV